MSRYPRIPLLGDRGQCFATHAATEPAPLFWSRIAVTYAARPLAVHPQKCNAAVLARCADGFIVVLWGVGGRVGSICGPCVACIVISSIDILYKIYLSTTKHSVAYTIAQGIYFKASLVMLF